MIEDLIAKGFVGAIVLLIAIILYVYNSDKNYTQEKIQVLEKRIDAIETKTASRK